MTKLLEWLVFLGTLGAIWLSFVTNKVENSFSKQYPNLLLFSPVIFAVLFGIYALVVVLYRTFTFNDCQKAAAELQEEIKEAREDLRKLGFKFKD